MTDLYIRQQSGPIHFSLPPNWQLLTFADFNERSGPADAQAATHEALKAPVDHPPLSGALTSDMDVAVIIEDPSRPSPKQQVLRAVLAELANAGITRDHIVVILGLGTHRKVGAEELERVYGKDLVTEYEFINHDCRAADLVPVGKLTSGTAVKINRRVHEADFVIGIGSIFPHPLNGFGGGGKIMFPAVADFDTILEHHLKYGFREGSGLNRLSGNHFHEEINRLAIQAGLNFIVNSVLDHNDCLYRIVCGDPIGAHETGVAMSRDILTMPFDGLSDVTIISSFPYTEGTQIMKPLAPASEITRPGGTIMVVTDCRVPLAEDYLTGCEQFRREYAPDLKAAVFDRFDHNQRIVEKGAPEFNMSMAQALLAQNDYRVILVSRDIDTRTTQRLGFDHANDIDQALILASEWLDTASVHVVPAGGVILPAVKITFNPTETIQNE